MTLKYVNSLQVHVLQWQAVHCSKLCQPIGWRYSINFWWVVPRTNDSDLERGVEGTSFRQDRSLHDKPVAIEIRPGRCLTALYLNIRYLIAHLSLIML